MIMENKIDISKLLKDCPRGMELDCTMYEDVCFDYVDELNIIHCYIQHEAHKTSITFNQHGTPNSDIKSKCVIFPKGKTTWEGFTPPCKFKVGDRIRWKADPKFVFTITSITKDKYECGKTFVLRFTNQDEYELVPNKFDTNTLVPFESRVLVRSDKSAMWKPAIYGIYRDSLYWMIGGSAWTQCIPYEGNEHLLGTTHDCDEYFRTW